MNMEGGKHAKRALLAVSGMLDPCFSSMWMWYLSCVAMNLAQIADPDTKRGAGHVSHENSDRVFFVEGLL
jgi:hypothetical protein